jgi:hypothetical protein
MPADVADLTDFDNAGRGLTGRLEPGGMPRTDPEESRPGESRGDK